MQSSTEIDSCVVGLLTDCVIIIVEIAETIVHVGAVTRIKGEKTEINFFSLRNLTVRIDPNIVSVSEKELVLLVRRPKRTEADQDPEHVFQLKGQLTKKRVKVVSSKIFLVTSSSISSEDRTGRTIDYLKENVSPFNWDSYVPVCLFYYL